MRCLFACSETCLLISAKYFAGLVRQLLPASSKIRSNHFLDYVWHWETQPLPPHQPACSGGLSVRPTMYPVIVAAAAGQGLVSSISLSKISPWSSLPQSLLFWGNNGQVWLQGATSGDMVTVPQVHKGDNSSSLGPGWAQQPKQMFVACGLLCASPSCISEGKCSFAFCSAVRRYMRNTKGMLPLLKGYIESLHKFP